jgi:hypothetical protein
VHEGNKRRAVFSITDGRWKDVTFFAQLDTEWMMRAFFTPAPKNLWDEMFDRHEKERQDLLQWEDMRTKLKRSASMETVRRGAKGGAVLQSERQESPAPSQQHECRDNSDSPQEAVVDAPHRWRSPAQFESDSDDMSSASASCESSWDMLSSGESSSCDIDIESVDSSDSE